MEQSSKCSLYRNLKNNLEVEKYLTVLVDPLKSNLVRFRTSNHRLPIELGRYNEIVRKDRLCTLCQSNDIGDEYHYLFICPFFKSSRDKYIPNKCIRNPSVLKFCEIMNGKNTSLLSRIAKFAGLICKHFSDN